MMTLICSRHATQNEVEPGPGPASAKVIVRRSATCAMSSCTVDDLVSFDDWATIEAFDRKG